MVQSAQQSLKFDRIQHIVLQPTTLCNLNCGYCYLPERQKNSYMHVGIPVAIASSLSNLDHTIEILWHGGEPLVVGITRFRQLLEPFEQLRQKKLVRHSIQTNATLITDEWCGLFKEFGFTIGVSIDGPAQHNYRRVAWDEKPAFNSIIRGIEKLKEHKIGFGVIAVVSDVNATNAREFYDFFRQLGCYNLAINIEEKEGHNRFSKIIDNKKICDFWDRLFQAWRECPNLVIREFDLVLGWLRSLSGLAEETSPKKSDLWPTVSTAGDVVVMSPEFIAANPSERDQFIVGNVMNDPLPLLVEQSLTAWYVHDILAGIVLCQQQCAYFSFCGGCHGSNKYYETGSFLTTETSHCRNTKQALVDTMLYQLSGEE